MKNKDLKTRDSLGGQNNHRSVSGARSSRALSTIFRKLRNADRRISELDRLLKMATYGGHWDSRAGKLKTQRDLWDLKRKNIRACRKSKSLA